MVTGVILRTKISVRCKNSEHQHCTWAGGHKYSLVNRQSTYLCALSSIIYFFTSYLALAQATSQRLVLLTKQFNFKWCLFSSSLSLYHGPWYNGWLAAFMSPGPTPSIRCIGRPASPTRLTSTTPSAPRCRFLVKSCLWRKLAAASLAFATVKIR